MYRLLVFAFGLMFFPLAAAAEEPTVLWQIGTSDNSTAELALAPANYKEYRQPGFFVVGGSDPKQDWPYVQPGVFDGGWAPGVPQTFVVLFGLKEVPVGPCRLTLDLADTHSKEAPKLRVEVNDWAREYETPLGAGDASVFGDPAKGREHVIAIDLPASVFKAGVNQVLITTIGGSWILWDSLQLTGQAEMVIQPVDPATIETAKEQARRRSQPWPHLEEVIIVSKTHFDIGYTDMAANVVRRYRTSMIDDALKVVEQSNSLPPEQQFQWTLPGWPLTKIMEDWPGQTPDRKQLLEAAFRQRRLVVHALPVTTHTETLELEDLVRGLGYSSRLSRSIDQPLSRDAKMTDVPSHSWIMPTLLTHAGVEFLHLGCNAASSSPEVPLLFWWEGPDGSRLLTMYSAAGYGTGVIPPRDWPHKTWLAMLMTGDNHGPPTPAEVRQVLDQADRMLPPNVKVRFGRLEDFADALLAEEPELPVVRGDMPDTWIHGPMSDPTGWKAARNLRPQIAAAESLGTLLKLSGAETPDPAETIAQAYEQSLLYGEHTWGGSIGMLGVGYNLPYGEAWRKLHDAGQFATSEASWEEHTDYSRRMRELIEPALADELQTLASSVGVEGRRIVVYNPLPWPRDGLVTLPAEESIPAAVKPTDGDEPVAVDRTEDGLQFFARAVPAMGYRTYVPVESSAPNDDLTGDPASATIESPFFKVVLDPKRGCIQSLIDKRTGRELVEADAPHGFGQYLYERFDLDQVNRFVKAYVKIQAQWALTELAKPGILPAAEAPYEAHTPENCRLEIVRSANAITATMSAPAGEGLPQPVSTSVTLFSDQPYIDVAVTLDEKPLEPWPEAGWICLPLNIPEPRFTLGRLGGDVDPSKDIVAGSNFDYLCLNGGMTVTGADGRGVGICPLDEPCVSLGRPGLWRYTAKYEPMPARVYVNLFNNQWSTNFRFWNGGTWTSRVRLWSIDGGNRESGLVTPSCEARGPLLAATFDGPAGKLPPARRGVELSRKGVLMTAFGPNPDGEGIVLRLWEQAGRGGPVTVTLPESVEIASVQPVDLRGRPLGEPIPVRDGQFDTPLGAYAPATFLITP